MQIKATRTTENEKKKTVKLKTAEKFSVKREIKNINSDSFNSSTAIYKNSSLTKKSNINNNSDKNDNSSNDNNSNDDKSNNDIKYY